MTQFFCIHTMAQSSLAERLAQQIAEAGATPQLVELPETPDRRPEGLLPAVLAGMARTYGGTLCVMSPECEIRGPLSALSSSLETADLALVIDDAKSWSLANDPRLLVLRTTPAAIAWLEQWARLSLLHCERHRGHIGATLGEALAQAGAALPWKRLSAAHADYLAGGSAGRSIIGLPPRTFSRPVAQSSAEVCPTSELAISVLAAPQDAISRDYEIESGAGGRAEDFKEYAARWGINQVWTLGFAIPAEHPRVHEFLMSEALAALPDRFVDDSRVLIAHDGQVYLHDPRAFAVALDAAELVLARDTAGRAALPAIAPLGLRLTPAVVSWIERVTRNYSRQLAQAPSEARLARAMAEELATPGAPRLICLPRAVEGTRDECGPETIACTVEVPEAPQARNRFTVPAPHFLRATSPGCVVRDVAWWTSQPESAER